MVLLFVALAIRSNAQIEQRIDASFAFEKGVKFYQAHKPDSAYIEFRKVLILNPQFAPAWYHIGLLFHDVSNLDSAEYYYDKAIQTDSSYSKPYSDLSVIKISQNKLQDARLLAEKSVRLDSTFVNGYLNLGSILIRLGEEEAGKEVLVRAARKDPGVVSNLGMRSLIENNNRKVAKFYFNIVLAAHPDHLYTLFNLGQTERILGEVDSAETHLERAWRVWDLKEQTFPLLYSSYFRVLLDRGKYDTVVTRSFQRVGDLYPDAYLYRSLAHYRMGDQGSFAFEAHRYFELSKQEVPSSLNTWAEEILRPKF